jgi:hypothetical protein
MINLAFIAGPHTVRRLSVLGDFDFALGHIAEQDLDNSLGYNSYFREQRSRGREVILDNAAYEKGGIPMPPAEMIPLIDHVQPSIIVAPDYYRNPERTIKDSRLFVEEMDDTFGLDRPKIMGVAHGTVMNEVLECVFELREFCDLVAVSKLLYEDAFSWMDSKSGHRLALGRNELCHRIEARDPDCRYAEPWFYLLGLGEPAEIAYHKHRDWIWGNDSTSCLQHGIHGVEIPLFPETLGDRRVLAKLDFLYEPTEEQIALALTNTKAMRHLQTYPSYGP